jgi:magnesium-transporting ATPase (P-type)
MSVVGSSTSAPNSVYIYCKGAPESMLKIMKSESIPADYLRVQEKYTSCGFRVLAIASRELTIEKVASLNR